MASQRRIIALMAVVVVIAFAHLAGATVMTYNSLSAFQSAAATASIPLSLDTLESLTADSSLSEVDLTGYKINDLTSTSLATTPGSAHCNGGSGCVLGTSGASGFSFTFDNPINAFGLLLDKCAACTIPTLTFNGNSISGVYSPNSSSPTTDVLGFFGLINDTAFTTVTLSGIASGNLLGFDDIRYGATSGASVAPEPSSLALLVSGLIALGLIAWRRAMMNV